MGGGGEGGVKHRAVQAGGPLHRDAQREPAFFGNALLAAGQPGGVELHLQVAAVEAGGDGQRHRQQHRAVVAVVGQRAERELARRGPGDVARRHTGGQGPFELGRQARVARVLPVGVPLGGVAELQPDPDSFPRARAVGRVGQQFGAHLVGLRRRLDGGAREQTLGLRRQRQAQRPQQEQRQAAGGRDGQ